jgi:diaminopimelate decarboxylase
MDSGTTQRMTCYVSGVHSGPNPSPGLGVAQSLRQAFPAARLVAVDYSVESSGLHSEVFDEVWVQRPWRELRLDVYAAAIQEVLDGGALWFAGQDLEVEWLTHALRDPSRAFVPPAQSLQQVAKPFIRAAAGLPLVVPDFVAVDRADWDLHAFCREHGWRVWVKGPNYEAMRVRDWPSFRFAWSTMSETWGTEQIFVQRHVLGSEESVALCAYRGELLDCVHLTKHTQTHEGKTWAGRVSQVDPALVEPLREVIAELEWTGGAELEYVRSADGTLNLIDWNPRFPAWIHAASFSGHNLPAKLVEAAGHGRAAPAPYRGSQFTRVVVEIPIRATHPLPAVRDPLDEWKVGSKHPSGMPDLARRLEAVRTGAEPRLESRKARPAPAVPAALQSDLDEAVLGELPTPRRVLLPRTARQRFAQVEHALAAQTVSGVELGFGYSVKTNPHPSLIALARGAGMFAEVISTAEMRQALAAGFTPDQIVLNGPAQRWPSLPALDGPLIAAFADSPQSLARWIGEGPPQARYLGLRVRPVTLDTSRFGTSFASPKDFARILGLLRALPSAQEVGLHFHFASDVIGPARWREVYEEIIHWASAIQQGIGRPVRCLDVGGGWFPDDFDREMLPRLDGLVGAAADLLPRLERFFVEPGKAMAQPTMALVTTVLEVRRGRKGTTEAVVDAAISDLPMAPFYPHRVYGRSANGSWEALGGRGDRLVGRICMETDILATGLALPDSLEVGQQLVIGDAGAYDASMAYNFGRGVIDDVCC